MVVAGETWSGTEFAATASSMKVIAALLRDPNPIHFDRFAAEAAGRGPLLVLQGPVSAALIYQAVLERWPAAVIQKASLRYIANVYEYETVHVEMQVGKTRSGEGGGIAEVQVGVLNAAGIEKVTGTLVVRGGSNR